MNSVLIRAIGGIVFLLSVMAVAIFLPAGSIHFWQGWLFLGTFGISVVAITSWLMGSDPALVERRMHAGPVGETRAIQKVVQSITATSFVGILIVAGLDRRFGWSAIPAVLTVVADVVVMASFGAIYLVFRENSFAASTIQVESGQKVISTGLYAHVRHPMYAAAVPMLVGMPLALGSWWALLPVVPLCAGLVARIFDEERALAAELPGYEAYLRSVRWRLIPMVW